MAAQTGVTAAEYLALPESSQPTMLLDGEIVVSPSATPAHQTVALLLIKLLLGIVKTGNLFFAPLVVHFDESNITHPDVLWIAPDSRCKLSGNEKHLVGPPDFIAEIASPSTVRFDRKEKFASYEKYGVREYWLIDPEAKLIEVWSLHDALFNRIGLFGPGEAFTSPLFGAIPGDAIFAEPN